MHPITLEYLAHEHLAELRRDANQPHVPESPPGVNGPSRARAWIVALFAATARRIRRHSASPAC